MTSITIDGLHEDDFRREIESDLRAGKDQAAVTRLRRLLAPYAVMGGVLPARFLTITPEDLTLRGWDGLAAALDRHDRPDSPITAISIAFGWRGDDAPGADSAGRLAPLVETSYFSDAAFPFSQCSRDDLLDGYSFHGCSWAADCEDCDDALALVGADDLHGALAVLEARLLSSAAPDPELIRAGSLGACLLAALLYQTVQAAISEQGLPRRLCVTTGCNGVYPYFDAPVAGMPDDGDTAENADDEDEAATTGSRYGSLLATAIPRARKQAVLVLAEGEDEILGGIDSLPAGWENAQSDAHRDLAPLDTGAEAGGDDRPWDFRDLLAPPALAADQPPDRAVAAPQAAPTVVEPSPPDHDDHDIEPEPAQPVRWSASLWTRFSSLIRRGR